MKKKSKITAMGLVLGAFLGLGACASASAGPSRLPASAEKTRVKRARLSADKNPGDVGAGGGDRGLDALIQKADKVIGGESIESQIIALVAAKRGAMERTLQDIKEVCGAGMTLTNGWTEKNWQESLMGLVDTLVGQISDLENAYYSRGEAPPALAGSAKAAGRLRESLYAIREMDSSAGVVAFSDRGTLKICQFAL